VGKWVKSNKQYQITTPNPEQVVLAQANSEFREVLNRADLAIPDGGGVIWAIKRAAPMQVTQNYFSSNRLRKEVISKLSQRRKAVYPPQFAEQFGRVNGKKNRFWQPAFSNFKRLSGVGLMVALCKLATRKGWRVMLLGGKDGVAEKAAKQLTINNQQLTITSFLGTQDISKETKEERKRVINKINDFRPHLLFVAYGAPYQELWIAKNLPLLRARVAMGVGGAFDYLAGKVPRAPKWIRNMGLEWLYRLIREPWRLKRQLALVKFIWLVLNEKSMIDR